MPSDIRVLKPLAQLSEPSRAQDAGVKRATSLKINELFYSLQGESTLSGLPTVFVRLTGCPLRCTYCDAEYAFYDGDWLSFDAVMAKIAIHNTRYVCVTGGEPLSQRACLPFLTRLCDAGYIVSLETSGAMDVSKVDPRVIKVMDLKTPASGEEDRNLYTNIEHLNDKDEVKFVICDRNDYEWTRDILAKYQLTEKVSCIVSSGYESLQPKELAEWVLEDGLNVRFQLQIHKYLWGDIPGV